ncbi:hypothetical protein ACFE04_015631 [Oxalis oulophora]
MSCDVALSPIRNQSLCGGGGGGGGGYRRLVNLCESIRIFLTVGESVIPMRILESDSVASVKLKIQSCKGFVVKNQKLVYGGRELARNDSLLRIYGVSCGNVLHLVLKLSDILFITVSTCCGKEFDFHVNRHRNVRYLKHRIAKIGENEGEGGFRVDEQDIYFDGVKLDDDQKVIDDICKDKNAAIHLVVQKSAKVRAQPVEKDLILSVIAPNLNEKWDRIIVDEKEDKGKDFSLEPVIVDPEIKLPPFIWDMINSTFNGLYRGNQPIRSTEGTGGTYLMQDFSGHDYVSVFKPMDEEPNAVNNPHGLPESLNGEGLKKGTIVGEGALREVAAYILDHPKSGPRSISSQMMGFSGVPPTVMVRCLHKGFNHHEGFDHSEKNVKIGSLQMFMKNSGNCEDMGPGAFPVEEVHKICVFDIRMANADRHAGNILISKGDDGRTVLIPIDHGYCLPETFEDCFFEWLYWPQARQPFSPDTIDYINSLDAEEDLNLLKYFGWDVPLESARTLRISTMLLKKGVARNLTPFAIGSIMCRQTIFKESVLEEIVREAHNSTLPGSTESVFLEAVSQIMDSRLDKLIL